MKMIQFDRRFYFVVIIPSLIILLLLLTRCKKDDHNDTLANTAVDVQQVADNFVSPIGVVASPDNTGRLFVIDQVGKIWIVNADGSRPSSPFIDVSGKMVSLMPGYDERGLLGLAFHPNFSTNGKFYLFYTAPPGPGGPAPGVSWDNLTTISEFHVSASNPDLADLTTE